MKKVYKSLRVLVEEQVKEHTTGDPDTDINVIEKITQFAVQRPREFVLHHNNEKSLPVELLEELINA